MHDASVCVTYTPLNKVEILNLFAEKLVEKICGTTWMKKDCKEIVVLTGAVAVLVTAIS